MSNEKNNVEFDLFADYFDTENLVVGAVKETVEKNHQGESSKKSNRIEDFGEKIGGARKDLYAAYYDLIKMATENEIENVPLSKSLPAPNYKKLLELGVEKWKVDAVRALRDTIPKKPKKYSWAILEWKEEMSLLRDISINVLENKWTEEEFKEEIARIKTFGSEYDFNGNDRKIAEKIEDYKLIYEVLGHNRDYSSLALMRNNEVDKPIVLCEMKNNKFIRKVLSYGKTKEEALKEYSYKKENYEEKKPSQKKTSLKVYSWRYSTYYFIGSKIGKEYAEIASPFETVEEAKKYLSEHQEELEEKLEKYRQTPYERESENLPRTGELKRTGDITPEKFEETFGFRGVEFGNWVENKTRQEDLNKAYDALMDMSEVLNLPPRALSLNGKLGLAFGARGKGGKNPPLAHYEPLKVVINLTKKNGSGNLGHEWFHCLDNYFGKKEKNLSAAMMTAHTYSETAENISQEVMEGFQMVTKVINQSDLFQRSQKLDSRRNSPYWALPEEMAARSFEVYLKSKLAEKGIRDDYLVNYRTDESWQKASEDGYKMENTYPYPTAAEMEDIKMAYDYLFDSIRFKTHEENYELYSATAENIQEMLKESRLLFERELNLKESALQKMSEEVFDIDLKYFEGAPELHGRYDEDRDIMYINSEAETSIDWTFWHEAFHIMKKYEPELYEDICNYIERHEIFTSEQVENYRKAINQPKMSESKVREELLADAFADMKTWRRIVEEMAQENQSTAQKLINFTKKLLEGVKKFFKSKEVQEKYPSVALTNKQFKNFVERVEENICSVQSDKGKLAKESKGYKILTASNIPHSPYKYAPEKQRKFDIESARELLKKYPSESVQEVTQDLSPLGQKNKNYGREILQEVRSYGR